MKKYHVNAFAKTINGGNPAGVVLNADFLSEKEMLALAKEIGFSETAFVSQSKQADFKVRFFTPSDEVDLCGHATIATFSLLKSLGILKAGSYRQETKAGILNVAVTEKDEIMMAQLIPRQYERVDKKLIADSLGISESHILTPPQVFSTGLKDIMVHLDTLDTMNQLKPDFNSIAKISKAYASTGYHVFTLQTLYGNTAHCRNFAPLYAIDEESATGTASGALAAYLVDRKLVPTQDGLNTLVFEQGYTMQQPSEILVQLTIDKNKITKVMVGGKSIIKD